MKKKTYPLLMLAFLLNFAAFAQTTYFHATCLSPIGCEASYYVALEFGSQPETGGVLTVDWGDGNTSTQNFTSTSGQTYDYLDISHAYSAAGTYPVSFNVYSGTASAYVGSSQDTTITSPGPSSCGYIAINTTKISPYVWYSNVPYKFTDVNGNTTILSPSTSYPGYNNLYIGLNPANAPYTVEIEPNWLTANNLVQSTTNLTISSFDANGAVAGSTPGQSYTVNVACNNSDPNPDFGITYSAVMSFFSFLQYGYLHLDICNYACSNTSTVSVSVQIPPSFVPVTTGLTNAVVSGNTLTFDIPNLSNCTYENIRFNFPGSTPAGTTFCFNVQLNHPNDSNLANNIDTVCGVVSNSYDPNDKSVDLPTNINPDAVDQLRYLIRFQNDGNANAANVVIRDSISPNLDLSTFQYLGAKHDVITSIDPATRVVTFTFENIDLGQSAVDLESSQGYVFYSISELPNLPVGTEIENTAYIYFDFNPAIVTNTTYNINQTTLGLQDNSIEQIGMFPNPAKDKLYFTGASVKEVTLYDLTGKVVLNSSDLTTNSISLSTVQTGIYQVVLRTSNGISTQKLVIQK